VSPAADNDLMLQVRDGDLGKLSFLFERYHRALFNFFLRSTGNRDLSEDLVQEAFLRLLKYRHTFRPDSRFVTISTGFSERSVDRLIQVPVNTSLKLNAVDGGDILVENVQGEIEVNNVDDDVKLNKVSRTVVAHTVDGDLTVSLLKVNPGTAMSFSSLDADIDVTSPADFKASVKAHTNNGEIYSDFEVQPAAATRAPVVKDERGKGGKYSVHLEKGVAGNINGRGQEVQFKTFDRDVYIRKAK